MVDLLSIVASDLFKILVSTVIGALIAIVGVWIGILHENKRWIFNTSIEIRTKNILEAYDQFLVAFFKINKAANIGEDKTTFDENINEPLNNYLIAINKIDIWVSEDASKKLRENLGSFRAMTHEIWITDGKPSIKAKGWKTFSNSLDKVKAMVSQRLRSEDLRKSIFSVEI
ncbi:hypothetical protein KKC60_04000 [Patescibacteria group bacterium]|nr:hypothetical protein [Patescibacteria group bacterium]